VEQIKGYKLDRLPIAMESLKKISDLIEFEGPVLSHFSDDKGRDYLFYWVDFDSDFNRWLVWKISKQELYNYLKRQNSLKELVFANNKDFIYSVDINNTLEYKNTHAIDLDELVKAYIPEENEYFMSAVPLIYESLIAEFEKDPYLQLLRENALYFKWNTRENSKRFLETVGAGDAGNFLIKISKSFLKYAEYTFYESYKEKIGDYNKLSKIINQFKEILQPRVVDLAYSSFKVGLSSDTVNSISEGNAYKDWQKNVLHKYQNDVIDVDYSSIEDVNIINENFPPEVRKEIFGPIISIINDNSYQLEVVNYKRTFKRKYQKVTKNLEQLLFPTIVNNEVQPETKRLYTFIIEAPEGGSNNVRFNKKTLQENTLFSQENSSVPLFIKDFMSNGSALELREALQCNLSLIDRKYRVECPSLLITVEEDTYKEAWDIFNKQIIEFFINVRIETGSNGPISPTVTTQRESFSLMIKSIVLGAHYTDET